MKRDPSRTSACGRHAGYTWHIQHHQRACQPCLDAHAADARMRRWHLVPVPWTVAITTARPWPDEIDLYESYERRREMADSIGLDPWAGAA